MSFYTLQISSTPSQVITSTLNGQQLKLWIRQLSSGIYCDISIVNGKNIARGVLCLNGTYLIRDVTSGVGGDFIFIDTQGNDDPTLDGLGTRFILCFRNDLK